MARTRNAGDLRKASFIALCALGTTALLVPIAAVFYLAWSAFPNASAPQGWKCDGAICHPIKEEWLGFKIGMNRDQFTRQLCQAEVAGQIGSTFSHVKSSHPDCLANSDAVNLSGFVPFDMFLAGFGCSPSLERPQGSFWFDQNGKRLKSIEVSCAQSFI